MSSSTRRRPRKHAVCEDIAELLKHAPHVHEKARFDMRERRAYHMGYYVGINLAIRAAAEAFDRFALRVQTLRASTRAKRRA
jgi:hypothetical protein